jgi:hypothetical protein
MPAHRCKDADALDRPAEPDAKAQPLEAMKAWRFSTEAYPPGEVLDEAAFSGAVSCNRAFRAPWSKAIILWEKGGLDPQVPAGRAGE